MPWYHKHHRPNIKQENEFEMKEKLYLIDVFVFDGLILQIHQAKK